MGETFFTTNVVFIISNSDNKEKIYDDNLDVDFEAELKIILSDKEVIESGIKEQILREKLLEYKENYPSHIVIRFGQVTNQFKNYLRGMKMYERDKKRISFYLTEEKKKKWRRFIESKEQIPTFSKLIREAVEFYIEKNNKLKKKDGHENIDVLLIENDLATVRLFKEIFKMNGYSYKTAISGQRGLNELKESIPKVVLLNIILPDIDGYEVCKQIKSNNNLKHIPVFYETAQPEWIVKGKIEETGANGYILKPFDLSTIIELLESIIPVLVLFEKKINDYISLKLENGKTYIYVNGKRFIQCIQLILNIQKEDIPLYDDINSIDEAAKVYKNYIYQNRIVQGPMAVPVRDQSHDITPEQEFWGHCSNLQRWYEHNYDTRLLHSNLAFPLLGALVDAGDPDAKKVFKKEITKSFNSGYQNTLISLFKARVLDYLNPKEKKQLIQQNFPSILKYIENANISPYIFKERLLDYLNPKEKIQLLQHIENLWKSNPDMFSYIFKIIDYLNPEEKKQLIQQNFPGILKYIENANRLIYIHHIFPNFLKIRGYLNPEEKKQLTQLIKLKKFF